MGRGTLSCVVIAAASVLAPACSYTHARQRAVMRNLRAGMEWVRAGHAGTTRALDRQPPLRDLSGVPLEELERALGPAHACGEADDPFCASPEERVFRFFRGADPRETEGPLLAIHVDELGVVREARWRRYAPPREEPPAEDASAVAIAAAEPVVPATGDAAPPELAETAAVADAAPVESAISPAVAAAMPVVPAAPEPPPPLPEVLRAPASAPMLERAPHPALVSHVE